MVIVGILLFVLLEVIVQFLPPHYNPLSQSESDLAVGPYGFLMALGFVIGGGLLLIFIAAFMRILPKEGQSRGGLIFWALRQYVSLSLHSRQRTSHHVLRRSMARFMQ